MTEPKKPFFHRDNWQKLCLLAGLQFLNFLILTVNYRAVAHGLYTWTALTDMLICLINWTLIKKVANEDSMWARVGYLFGGTTAGIVGIWITQSWGK